jgi:hypothetical protein
MLVLVLVEGETIEILGERVSIVNEKFVLEKFETELLLVAKQFHR